MIANMLMRRIKPVRVVKGGWRVVTGVKFGGYLGGAVAQKSVFRRSLRVFSNEILDKMDLDEDDEDYEEHYKRLEEMRTVTAENILSHDLVEFQKIIKIYSNMELVDQNLYTAFERWMVDNREDVPDYTFVILCEKVLKLRFKVTQPLFYERMLVELLKEARTISADRVIKCLKMVDSGSSIDEPSPFTKRFVQELEKAVTPIYNNLSVESQIAVLKMALHSKKSMNEIPPKWVTVLSKISSTGNLLDSEPILALLFDLGMESHIPEDLLEKIENLAQSDNNSLRIQLMVLNLLDKKFKSGSGDKNVLEEQLLKILKHLTSEYQDIYFGSLMYYLDFCFNFFNSRSLNYRKFEGSIEEALKMLVTYYDEGSEIFNLEETIQILDLYHKGNNILKTQVSENYNGLIHCLINGARLSQQSEIKDRIAYIRVLNLFIESNNYIGLLDNERTSELMVELVRSLTSKQVTFEEFMEISTQITQLRTNADKDAIDPFDIEHLYLLFSQQAINLRFKSYDELVKVLTVLDFMIEDIPQVENTKIQLLQKFTKKSSQP